uniref:Uncharacterized protein n=1 Tax=Utricularia reniformis TaxID=192314 RepID=A0A1Y0B150_9LAMI|nr:hypothetical protein AEK19_MT0876 [Utricularia reniformis]ART31108.1 hypothetical protein AEK19_MT0876 [Utricularia reniformis]
MTCKLYYAHPSSAARGFHYQEVYPRLLVLIFPDTCSPGVDLLVVNRSVRAIDNSSIEFKHIRAH